MFHTRCQARPAAYQIIFHFSSTVGLNAPSTESTNPKAPSRSASELPPACPAAACWRRLICDAGVKTRASGTCASSPG